MIDSLRRRVVGLQPVSVHGIVVTLLAVTTAGILVAMIVGPRGFAAGRGRPYARQLPDRAASDGYLVGAYYYPWYGPGRLKWADGHLNQPDLGEYSSGDPDVVSQHIELATGSGIDFFLVSWWGPGTSTDTTLQHALLGNPAIGEIRFAIDYESDGRLIVNNGTIDLDDTRNQDVLASDLRYLEGSYWNNAQYLKVNGANVLFLYSSHEFVGDVAGVLASLRQQASDDGYAIYLLGDEVSWGGSAREPAGRIQAFDAITSYNMYTPGAGGRLNAFSDAVSTEYSAWQQRAEALSVSFVPDAVPGFDDLPVRPDAHHPPLTPSPALFREQLAMALAHAEPPLNLVLITSWNEWNEGTAIEPSTQFGGQYLDILRQTLDSLSPAPTGAT
ncbi:MAG TPA: glycoside hydrolase family 99-like domain-containing protein [Chloroflexota bacterium]